MNQIPAVFRMQGQQMNTPVFQGPGFQGPYGPPMGFPNGPPPSSYGPIRNQPQRQRYTPVKHRAPPSPTNVYVSQFPTNWGRNELKTLFSPYGTIETIRVMTKSNSPENRGVAFIHFRESDSAGNAIQALNLTTQLGATTPMVVKPANLNKHQGGSAGLMGMRLNLTRVSNQGYQLESTTNVYISEVPTDWKDEKLRSLFETFGEVSRLSVLTKKGETGENRGVGFIHYVAASAAIKAVATMDQTQPEGASGPISVKFANVPKGMLPGALTMTQLTQMESVTNIYVCQFPNEWAEKELREVFSIFGDIAEIKVLTKQDLEEKNRGVSFVHYEDPSSAVKAVSIINDTKPLDAKLPLSVSFAKVHASSLAKYKERQNNQSTYMPSYALV